MREVLYKNLTSLSSRKKDVFLREVFQKDGVLAKTERRYLYFIKEVCHIKDEQEIQGWIDEQNKMVPPKKRHFHILKDHNDELGEERLVCKVAGTFYVVVGREVYTVAFLHSFKVRLNKDVIANK